MDAEPVDAIIRVRELPSHAEGEEIAVSPPFDVINACYGEDIRYQEGGVDLNCAKFGRVEKKDETSCIVLLMNDERQKVLRLLLTTSGPTARLSHNGEQVFLAIFERTSSLSTLAAERMLVSLADVYQFSTSFLRELLPFFENRHRSQNFPFLKFFWKQGMPLELLETILQIRSYGALNEFVYLNSEALTPEQLHRIITRFFGPDVSHEFLRSLGDVAEDVLEMVDAIIFHEHCPESEKERLTSLLTFGN